MPLHLTRPHCKYGQRDTQRGRPVNLNNPANTYDLAVQHGHDLTDAADRRRQTHRFQRWMSSRSESGPAPLGGR